MNLETSTNCDSFNIKYLKSQNIDKLIIEIGTDIFLQQELPFKDSQHQRNGRFVTVQSENVLRNILQYMESGEYIISSDVVYLFWKIILPHISYMIKIEPFPGTLILPNCKEQENDCSHAENQLWLENTLISAFWFFT